MSKVYFVGCGAGDPELITIKAKKLIQKADVLVYSGSLIPTSIVKLCKKGKKLENFSRKRSFWKKSCVLDDWRSLSLQYVDLST